MQEGDITRAEVWLNEIEQKLCYFLPKQDTAFRVIEKDWASITPLSSEVFSFYLGKWRPVVMQLIAVCFYG